MIRFLGTRGTISVSGADFAKYGGNTACLMIPVDDKRCIVLDGGTGIYNLNNMGNFEEYHIFLTHLHWDHICGLPLFRPFYTPGKHIFLYLEDKSSLTSKDFLKVLFNPPFFPIPRTMLKSNIRFNLIRGGQHFVFGAITVFAAEGNHPDGALMYKIQDGNTTTLFATDFEHGTERDDFLIEFGHGCDYLVFDTTYTPEEYEGKNGRTPKIGWGHSTYEKGAELALKGNMKNLVLYHHNPDYTDKDLDAMFEAAKKVFPSTICAYDGFEIK